MVTDDDPINPKFSVPNSVTINVRNINDPPSCELGQTACPEVNLPKKARDPAMCKLWPPNHKMKLVTIVGVADPDSNDVTLRVTGVTQDEPVNELGDGDSSPDAVIQVGASVDSVLVRAERTGLGGAQENGRVYHIDFVADDGFESCTGSAAVGVPHDVLDTPVDDAPPFFDSLEEF